MDMTEDSEEEEGNCIMWKNQDEETGGTCSTNWVMRNVYKTLKRIR
jgi:hypothetical protein